MSVEEIIDRLYALPLEEFTPARNQEERALRKAGERDQAERVKALRKPTVAAAAANHLVRAHRSQVEAFLRAAGELRDAQFAGKGDLASAAGAEQAELEKLISLGGEAIRPTLQAAAVDDNTAAELLEGRLVREPEPAGFGTLLAYVPPAGSRPTARRPTAERATSKSPPRQPRGGAAPTRTHTTKPSKPDDTAARIRLDEATQMLQAAAADQQQARRDWTQAQRELETAQAAVAKAQAIVERSAATVEKAQASVEKARHALERLQAP